MNVKVMIECLGCTCKTIVESQKELNAGSWNMGALFIDGFRIQCRSCGGNVFRVVDVDASS